MNDHSTEVVTRIAASTRQVRRPGSVKRSSSMDLKENRNIAYLTPFLVGKAPPNVYQRVIEIFHGSRHLSLGKNI